MAGLPFRQVWTRIQNHPYTGIVKHMTVFFADSTGIAASSVWTCRQGQPPAGNNYINPNIKYQRTSRRAFVAGEGLEPSLSGC